MTGFGGAAGRKRDDGFYVCVVCASRTAVLCPLRRAGGTGGCMLMFRL